MDAFAKLKGNMVKNDHMTWDESRFTVSHQAWEQRKHIIIQ